MCGNYDIQDTCVSEIVCPHVVLLSGEGSSQQGCWRPRFAKLVNAKFRICNFYQKKTHLVASSSALEMPVTAQLHLVQ